MDKVTECTTNILLLGDFNIDLFKQPPAWNNTTTLFGLEQLVEEATRVTKSSATLIDHIYTNNKQQVQTWDFSADRWISADLEVPRVIFEISSNPLRKL